MCPPILSSEPAEYVTARGSEKAGIAPGGLKASRHTRRPALFDGWGATCCEKRPRAFGRTTAREGKRAAKGGKGLSTRLARFSFYGEGVVSGGWHRRNKSAHTHPHVHVHISARVTRASLIACTAVRHCDAEFHITPTKYVPAFIIVRNGLNLSSCDCRTYFRNIISTRGMRETCTCTCTCTIPFLTYLECSLES